jgi:ferrochelatase
MPSEAPQGIVLMTYGSATTAEHVAAYLSHVYPQGPPEGLVTDFENRYNLVGGSPLIGIVERQAALLQETMSRVIVRAGMLHSAPFIAEAVRELRQVGVERITGIILAPQYSPLIMAGYGTALHRAAPEARVAPAWPTEEHFIRFLAESTCQAIDRLRRKHGRLPVVLFTTHSLPEKVVARDPAYLDQLKATTNAIVVRLGTPELVWHQAYQSAGHTPEAWLKPDIVDVLAQLERDVREVLIVPIQFLADHLEILYDLDIAGKEQCAQYDIEYNRIRLPNLDPLFIQALAAVASSVTG